VLGTKPGWVARFAAGMSGVPTYRSGGEVGVAFKARCIAVAAKSNIKSAASTTKRRAALLAEPMCIGWQLEVEGVLGCRCLTGVIVNLLITTRPLYYG